MARDPGAPKALNPGSIEAHVTTKFGRSAIARQAVERVRPGGF